MCEICGCEGATHLTRLSRRRFLGSFGAVAATAGAQTYNTLRGCRCRSAKVDAQSNEINAHQLELALGCARANAGLRMSGGERASLIIAHCLFDLLARIHHERAVLDDGLEQRLPGEQ